MKKRTDGKAGRVERGAETPASPKVRFRLLTKIVVFLLLVLVPLAAVSSYFAYQSLRTNLTEEFTNKGTAIAKSLASSSVDLIVNRDASTVQALFDQFADITGVAYVMVYDPQQTMIAHTFVPTVPRGIIEKNPVSGTAKAQVREIEYADPAKGTERHIIDVGVPMLAGQLGTVRVGMDKEIILTGARNAGLKLLGIFGTIAALGIVAAVVFAGRLTRPVTALVTVAQRVGQGGRDGRGGRPGRLRRATKSARWPPPSTTASCGCGRSCRPRPSATSSRSSPSTWSSSTGSPPPWRNHSRSRTSSRACLRRRARWWLSTASSSGPSPQRGTSWWCWPQRASRRRIGRPPRGPRSPSGRRGHYTRPIASGSRWFSTSRTPFLPSCTSSRPTRT